jgi:hypothetical protein
VRRPAMRRQPSARCRASYKQAISHYLAGRIGLQHADGTEKRLVTHDMMDLRTLVEKDLAPICCMR